MTGTVTEVKRTRRGWGRGELQVRFDSLTLPNGVNRDFRADLGSIDARDGEKLKKSEGTVQSPGDAERKVAVIGGGGAMGAGIGAAAGGLKGAGVGAGIGAAAGLTGVLLTRGPEATLSKGSSVEMVLDRPLIYQTAELDFSGAPAPAAISEGGNRNAQPHRVWPSPIPIR